MRIRDWSSDVCSSDLPNLGKVVRYQLRYIRVSRVAPGTRSTLVHRARSFKPGRSVCRAAVRVRTGPQHPVISTKVLRGRRAIGAVGDRQSVVEGKSVAVRVDHGGGGTIKKKKD